MVAGYKSAVTLEHIVEPDGGIVHARGTIIARAEVLECVKIGL